MSIHLIYISGVVHKSLESLQNEVKLNSHNSTSSTAHKLSNHVTSIANEVSVINGKELTIHRVFAHTADSGAYETVGWVLTCDVKHCMICSTSFGYFTYQHHCVACGNIVCQKCSSNEALVFEIQHLGAKREMVYSLHRHDLSFHSKSSANAEKIQVTSLVHDTPHQSPAKAQTNSLEHVRQLQSRINEIHSHLLTGASNLVEDSDEEMEGGDNNMQWSAGNDNLKLLAESERAYHSYLEQEHQNLNNHHDERHYSTVPIDSNSNHTPSCSESPVDFAPVIHLEFIEALVHKPRDVVLSEHHLAQVRIEAQGVGATESIITGIVTEVALLNDNPVRIQRVFVRCVDSFEYGGVGWVLSCDVHHCMNCYQSFSGLVAAHHCYGCGNIVCRACSDSQGVVFELQNLGPLRVCTRCYWGQEMVYAQHGTASHSQSRDPEPDKIHKQLVLLPEEKEEDEGVENVESSVAGLEQQLFLVSCTEARDEALEAETIPRSLESIPRYLSFQSDMLTTIQESASLTNDTVDTASSTNTSSSPHNSPNTARILHPKPPHKHGWLKKQGHLVKNWKSRYFVLDNGYLTYYVDKLDAPPFGRDMKGQLCLAGYREKEVSITPTSATKKRAVGNRRVSFTATSSGNGSGSNWSRVEELKGVALDGGELVSASHEEDEDSETRRLCRIHMGSNMTFGMQNTDDVGERSSEVGHELLLEAASVEERLEWVSAIHAHTLYVEDMLETESAAHILLLASSTPVAGGGLQPTVPRQAGKDSLKLVTVGKVNNIINSYSGGGTSSFYKKQQKTTSCGSIAAHGRSSPVLTRTLSTSSKRLSIFLKDGEELRLSGLVTKPNPMGIQLMRELLWTSANRLLYIDPKTLELKGEVKWSSNGFEPHPKIKQLDATCFEIVDCRKKVYKFFVKDDVSVAEWISTIERGAAGISGAAK